VTGLQTIASPNAGRAASLSEARALRLLTLTPFYPSVENSPQGCFISESLPELTRQRVISHVIAVQPFYRGRARPVPSEIESRWHSYFCIPGNLGLPFSGEFLAASLMKRVRQLHAHHQFDLIHAHSALPCGAAALSLSKRLGIPFVVTVHGLDTYFTLQTGGWIGKWCMQISREIYESASNVICISEKVREKVAEAANARTAIVYNGVDPSLFFPAAEEHPIILSVGNLIPSKGHALLLRAFVRVASSFPDWSLEIIGEGSERGNLIRLVADLRITSRVHFLARCHREEVATAMRRCSVFALPSAYEGLGCVYLEAMASRKAVIGCSGQGIDEIIEHGRNGLLISPGSESELSDALTTLLSNQDLRRRIGRAARRTVLSQHTLAHQAAHLAEIYRECVR